MLMVLIASGKRYPPAGSSIPESRSAAFKLGSNRGLWNPTPGGAIPQKEKAGTRVPALSSRGSLFFERDLTLLFLLRFFRLFLRRGFLLRRFLGRLLRRRFGRRLWRGRLFLRLLADDHQFLFLGFDDLFRFARQFLVVFQP